MSKTVINSEIASKAKLWGAMVSPFRARPVADMVRGKTLEDANRILLLEKQKSAKILLKILRSAMANAQQKGVADLDRLFVSFLGVNEGPRLKRWMPRAQGRADQRMTRTSHIELHLAERKAKASGAKKAAAPKAAKKTKTSSGDKK